MVGTSQDHVGGFSVTLCWVSGNAMISGIQCSHVLANKASEAKFIGSVVTRGGQCLSQANSICE